MITLILYHFFVLAANDTPLYDSSNSDLHKIQQLDEIRQMKNRECQQSMQNAQVMYELQWYQQHLEHQIESPSHYQAFQSQLHVQQNNPQLTQQNNHQASLIPSTFPDPQFITQNSHPTNFDQKSNVFNSPLQTPHQQIQIILQNLHFQSNPTTPSQSPLIGLTNHSIQPSQQEQIFGQSDQEVLQGYFSFASNRSSISLPNSTPPILSASIPASGTPSLNPSLPLHLVARTNFGVDPSMLNSPTQTSAKSSFSGSVPSSPSHPVPPVSSKSTPTSSPLQTALKSARTSRKYSHPSIPVIPMSSMVSSFSLTPNQNQSDQEVQLSSNQLQPTTKGRKSSLNPTQLIMDRIPLESFSAPSSPVNTVPHGAIFSTTGNSSFLFYFILLWLNL